MAALVNDRIGAKRSQFDPRNSPCRLRPKVRPGLPEPAVTSRGTHRVLDRPVAAAIAVLAFALFGGSIVDAAGAVVGGEAPVESQVAAAGPAVEGGVHLVQPGQTYWSIADALGGSGDIRIRVDALQAANHERVLRAGDRLVVPALGQVPLGARR